MIAVTAAALVGMATATSAVPFFAVAFVIGLCSTGTRVLILLLAHLAPVERRGRVVGNIMAGLLTGIMLARPALLFIATSFGWRAVFWGSAALTGVIGLVLARTMPAHRPAGGRHYGHMLADRGHSQIATDGTAAIRPNSRPRRCRADCAAPPIS